MVADNSSWKREEQSGLRRSRRGQWQGQMKVELVQRGKVDEFQHGENSKGEKKGKEVEGQEEEEEEWKKGERRRKDNGAPVGLFWCLV